MNTGFLSENLKLHVKNKLICSSGTTKIVVCLIIDKQIAEKIVAVANSVNQPII